MRTQFPRTYRKMMFTLSLSLLFVLLLIACSGSKTSQPPTTPTTVQENTPPMETAQASNPATSTAETEALPPTATVPAPTPTEEPSPTTTLPPTATPVPTETPLPPTPTDTATPTLGIGSTRTIAIDQMVQIYVPAGEFLMGAADSDEEAKRTIAGGRAYPENPQHTVYLDGYWIDKYEVTNRQYALCVAAGACELPWVTSSYTYDKYYGNPEFDNYPVIWVNWFKVRDYCTWAGRRLPTEAEWEKAARGTDGAMYPWGNEPLDGTRANFCDVNCTRTHALDTVNDGYPDTAPVGSYPAGASPYGAMDMSGNVWEWVSSLIAPYPYDANDGREDPDSPDERAWRGGPWSNGYWWMRSSVRYRSVNWYQWYVLGFRCASSE